MWSVYLGGVRLCGTVFLQASVLIFVLVAGTSSKKEFYVARLRFLFKGMEQL